MNQPTPHDQDLSQAFDDQAPRFELRGDHANPEKLAHLIRMADFPPGSRVLDVGCGTGLVSEALLKAGHTVFGVDLSREMLGKARQRCSPFGASARFEQISVFDAAVTGPFDAAISRFVLHHVTDPAAFVRRPVELLRPGGVLVLADHTADPDPAKGRWHNELEHGRDRTHTNCLSPGALLDLFAAAGLVDLRISEDPFVMDFDDWYDRGSPIVDRAESRRMLLNGTVARGFEVCGQSAGAIQVRCRMAIVRGVKPG